MKHLSLSLLLALVLYLASMIDGRVFYDPQEVIECKVGIYTFEIMRKDCK
jgi:hypothetical protein